MTPSLLRQSKVSIVIIINFQVLITRCLDCGSLSTVAAPRNYDGVEINHHCLSACFDVIISRFIFEVILIVVHDFITLICWSRTLILNLRLRGY